MEHYFTNNENLKSEIRKLHYTYQNQNFSFFSDNGVFAKDKIDYGSRFLIETFLEEEKQKNLQILDVGCGYGFMGIVAAKILDSKITMCDINKRAIHLAQRNIIENKIRGETILSNIYENIKEKYDVIITNPPIRAGKSVVLNILINSKIHLKEKGTLWFVIRKDQGAKTFQKELQKISDCQIIKKSKGFYIMRAEFS